MMQVFEGYAGTGSGGQAFEDRGHKVIRLDDDSKLDKGTFDVHLRVDMLEFVKDPWKYLDDGFNPKVCLLWPPCTAFSMAGKGSYAAWVRANTPEEELTLEEIELKANDPPLEAFRWHYDADHPFFGPRLPNDEQAKLGCQLVLAGLECVRVLEPEYWWLENPMGGLRTMGFMEALVDPYLPEAQEFVDNRPDYVSEELARWIIDTEVDHHDVTYCRYWNPRLDVEPEPRMKRTDLWGVFPDEWVPRGVCGNGMPCHATASRGMSTGTQALHPTDRARVPYELGNDIARACEVALDDGW